MNRAGTAILTLLILFVVGSTVYSYSRDQRFVLDSTRLTLLVKNVHQPLSVDARFAGIRKVLPERGTIGYLSTRKHHQLLNHVDSSGAYFLAQYALAPLVLDRTPFHDLVVANFTESTLSDISPHITSPDFELMLQGNDGVFLLRRKQKSE